MNKETNNCCHFFEYSHKEHQTISFGGTNMREVDVVLCRKCGKVKRK